MSVTVSKTMSALSCVHTLLDRPSHHYSTQSLPRAPQTRQRGDARSTYRPLLMPLPPLLKKVNCMAAVLNSTERKCRVWHTTAEDRAASAGCRTAELARSRPSPGVMEVKAARGDAALASSADGSEENSWQYQAITSHILQWRS